MRLLLCFVALVGYGLGAAIQRSIDGEELARCDEHAEVDCPDGGDDPCDVAAPKPRRKVLELKRFCPGGGIECR